MYVRQLSSASKEEDDANKEDDHDHAHPDVDGCHVEALLLLLAPRCLLLDCLRFFLIRLFPLARLASHRAPAVVLFWVTCLGDAESAELVLERTAASLRVFGVWYEFPLLWVGQHHVRLAVGSLCTRRPTRGAWRLSGLGVALIRHVVLTVLECVALDNRPPVEYALVPAFERPSVQAPPRAEHHKGRPLGRREPIWVKMSRVGGSLQWRREECMAVCDGHQKGGEAKDDGQMHCRRASWWRTHYSWEDRRGLIT
mmetsp:Transcript_27251/g.67983  ORF Transcript_27251/g.67983 Transcript_27251/m.67983 type:complete len:255 (+) Transcript_27251:915-1679(+)